MGRPNSFGGWMLGVWHALSTGRERRGGRRRSRPHSPGSSAIKGDAAAPASFPDQRTIRRSGALCRNAVREGRDHVRPRRHIELVAAQDPAPRARLRLARPHRPLHRLRPAVAAWGWAGQGHPAVRARRVHRPGHHKLAAYRWNLVERFAAELVFIVAEVDLTVRTAQLRLKAGFEVEALGARPLVDGLIHAEPAFRVSTAVLEHGTPCLAFAVEETTHVNVWKNRLAER